MKENSNISTITIIGNTTWGQAIATLIDKEKVNVNILCRTESEVKDRVNKLDEVKSLPSKIKLSSDVSVINNSELIIFAFPSQSIISNLKIINNNLNKNHKFLIASKGIEKTTGRRLSEVLSDEITFINKKNIAILSGPNLAKEIYENKTTSTVIASNNLNLLNNIKTIIESNKFKIYLSEDTIGVELGGALKNIVTLGAGICDGLNIGNNLKGAFISIAFSEVVKLALSAGAQSITISGLSGLGDTLASSYSPLSRNRLAGQYLAEGYSINIINKKINNIIEGLDTLYGAKALSEKLNIDHEFIDLLIDVFNQTKHPNDLLRNTIGNI
ncbi:MAG: glycerol-3-phosphate dehydrogenase [NAD(P)+] [Chloroflexota bacterium]|nr:MAG: glycerol-3-phosphate dehydrogenase [NAD(P)+] [Chloroflexota bacterium]